MRFQPLGYRMCFEKGYNQRICVAHMRSTLWKYGATRHPQIGQSFVVNQVVDNVKSSFRTICFALYGTFFVCSTLNTRNVYIYTYENSVLFLVQFTLSVCVQRIADGLAWRRTRREVWGTRIYVYYLKCVSVYTQMIQLVSTKLKT